VTCRQSRVTLVGWPAAHVASAMGASGVARRRTLGWCPCRKAPLPGSGRGLCRASLASRRVSCQEPTTLPADRLKVREQLPSAPDHPHQAAKLRDMDISICIRSCARPDGQIHIHRDHPHQAAKLRDMDISISIRSCARPDGQIHIHSEHQAGALMHPHRTEETDIYGHFHQSRVSGADGELHTTQGISILQSTLTSDPAMCMITTWPAQDVWSNEYPTQRRGLATRGRASRLERLGPRQKGAPE
jgi:hypothetical protein